MQHVSSNISRRSSGSALACLVPPSDFKLAPSHGELFDWLLRLLAPGAAAVANFVDHSEHAEGDAQKKLVLSCADNLRMAAATLARRLDRDLLGLYADRLDSIERRTPRYPVGNYLGLEAARRATTLYELQLVQGDHDERYHADIQGLPKIDQLRHCSLHLSKLLGELALAATEGCTDDFTRRRLPDMLVFGLKIATIMGQRLPNTPLALDPEIRPTNQG